MASSRPRERCGRTAATLVFLDLDGVEMAIDEDALVDHLLAVAQGQLDKPAIAAFLRTHAVA